MSDATFRILDANFNRAKEAARVLEDTARFSLNHAGLSGQIKELRHGLRRLSEAIEKAFAVNLHEHRDTPGDVGTAITGSGEHDRRGMLAILQANFKRLEESLRVIEEYAKLQPGSLGLQAEALRYNSYDIEKRLLICAGNRDRLGQRRLYLVLNPDICRLSPEDVAQKAARGGVKIIQLRAKGGTDLEKIALANAIKKALTGLDCLLLMNDRVDLAMACQADGAHLGSQDMPWEGARKILGGKILGATAHSLEEAKRAEAAGADYIGCGSAFVTASKADAVERGPDFIRQIQDAVSPPVYAIGGISKDNVFALAARGVRRIAVGSEISKAVNPEDAARAFLPFLENTQTV